MMKRTQIFGGALLALAAAVVAYPAASDFVKARFNGGERRVASQAIPSSALTLLQGGLKNFGSQIADTMEKSSVARKEMGQSDLNYDGAKATALAAQAADDRTGSPEVAEAMCAVAEDQTSLAGAQISSDMWAKAITKTNLERGLSSPSPAVSIKQSLDRHFDKYCSDDDQLHSRCDPKGDGMQDADVQLATAMHPNLGQTLSQEEYDAALAASRNIVNAVPSEDVPVALENSSRGKAYLLEKRSGEAVLSLSDNAFAQIIARRRSREDAQQ